MWQLSTYKLLTALIITISYLRYKLAGNQWELRKDRDEQNLIPGYWISKARGIIIECCDCGLSHRFFESEKGTHCWPERPKGYNYKWRFGR